MTTVLALLVLAEAAGDLTLPLFAWAAIASGLTAAVAWMTRTYKASVEANAQQTAALVREVVEAMTVNNELLRNHAELLRQLTEMVRGLRNG